MRPGRFSALVGVGLLGLSSAACMSLTPADVAVAAAPIDLALSTPALALRIRAEAGEAQASYALSIVFAHGLQGLKPDPEQARRWRTRAVSVRGFTPITQYIAGYKHQPGRVVTTSIPRYDIAPLQAALIETCVGLLASPPGLADLRAALDRGGCGGRDNYARLARLWTRSSLPMPHVTA